jgi:hypothetical protein
MVLEVRIDLEWGSGGCSSTSRRARAQTPSLQRPAQGADDLLLVTDGPAITAPPIFSADGRVVDGAVDQVHPGFGILAGANRLSG